MRSLSILPNEVQLAIVRATLEPVRGLFAVDEIHAMIHNRDVLKVLVRVCRLWNSIGTPLLYEQVVLHLERKPEGVHMASLVRTLQASPDLGALVRGVHTETIWASCGASLASFYIEVARLPGLSSLSLFRAWDGAEQLDFGPLRLTSLEIELSTDYGSEISDRPIAHWFDTTTLTRLDLIFNGTNGPLITHVLAKEALPALVDLRISNRDWWTDSDHENLRQGLCALGPQLQTLHLLIEEPSDAEESVFDVPALCPSLRELAYNPFRIVDDEWGTVLDPDSTWSNLSLDRLILRTPNLDGVFNGYISKDVVQSLAAAIGRIPAKTIAMADLDLACVASPQSLVGPRRIADSAWARDRRTVLEDKYGRILERSASIASATGALG